MESKIDPRLLDAEVTTDLEGYFLWFIANSESKQARYFKFALGRLAKEHPDVDPRKVILEFFSESIHKYEQHVRKLRGKDAERKIRMVGSRSYIRKKHY